MDGSYDGAVMTDDEGRRQWLCGVWRLGPLRAGLAAIGDTSGAAMKHLAAGLRVVLTGAGDQSPPGWFDCDTEFDLRRAEEWSRGNAG
jgi:hypothetical protein